MRALAAGTKAFYTTPLKALSNDIEKNLAGPLSGIRALAAEQGVALQDIRVAVRSGDTPQSERAVQRKHPPHVLVTTPESLYLLLTSQARDRLRHIDTVIFDEIHALARDKRGSHLTLTLERLASLCEVRPVRIGLSATQRPLDRIANFLTGIDVASEC